MRRRSLHLLGSLLHPLRMRLALTAVVVVVSTAAQVAGPAIIAFGIDNGLPALLKQDWFPLAAAGVARREYDHAMRFASEAPDDLVALAGRDDDAGDDLVALWKKTIEADVRAGATVDELTLRFGCPEFLATQLRRQIKREQREEKEAAAPKPAATPSVGKPTPALQASLDKLAAAKKKLAAAEKKAKAAPAKKVAGAKAAKSARAIITDGTRVEVKKLVEAGRTGHEIAKAVGISLPSVQNIKKQLGLVRRK